MADCWGEAGKKYALDEETVQFTEALIRPGYLANFYTYPNVQAAREDISRAVTSAPTVPFAGTIDPITVPGSGTQPAVQLYVYKPDNLPADPTIVINFHGGGLVVCFAKENGNVAKVTATECGVILVDVEYRLLPDPEDPLAPFNDALTASKWVLANKTAVGGTANSKVGVAGDSAGGQISCSLTKDLRELDFQILIYPVADVDLSVPTVKEFWDIPAFCGRDMEKMFELALPSVPDGANNPRFNPSANPKLELSPPTLILSAELDPILDWAVAYEGTLKAKGVRVSRMLFKGIPHVFHAFPLLFPKACRKAHDRVKEFLQSI